MSLFDDFKKYRDQFGLNGLYTDGTNGHSTQNGALFTLEYLICLLGDPNTPDSVKQAEVARLVQVYKDLERFPGISTRIPPSYEFDSMDNTGAIATFSGLFDNGRYSKLSYEHGNNTHATGIDLTQDPPRNTQYFKLAGWVSVIHCWTPASLYRWVKSGFKPKMFWNNNTPDLFCLPGWHGRSPGHIAYLRMTAGKWVGPLGQLSVLVGQFLGCFKDKGNADARKLPYTDWQFLKKRNIFWKLAYKLWCHILMKQYPNGMADVYRMYYGDPNHPMRTYPKKFEP